MKLGITLIDRASRVCGSDSELAKRLNVHKVAVAEMRSGKRVVSPATGAELAGITGDDAKETAVKLVVESVVGTRREKRIRELLGSRVLDFALPTAAEAAGLENWV